jgi:hypothetical protein
MRFLRGRSRELGYAEVTSDISGIVSTVGVQINGLTLSNLAIPLDRPVEVMLYVSDAFNTTANASVDLTVFDPSLAAVGAVRWTSATASANGPVLLRKRYAPGQCPTGFSVFAKVTAGSATLRSGGAFPPAFITVRVL